MEHYGIVLILLAVATGASAWADKLKISYPIVLIVAGIIIGSIPAIPAMKINPEMLS
ncbi:hypothetical protein [Agriterribacter sp.]|uniref:hypothetical protein n=1 Tax=Agriterribacter sp. TaxID=2821509 RepID=UPI002C5B7459|nr:hypothetical protein [Agriterribacter sp.]HRP58115.1 hypothetical protein [Agriterribacter sp.]